MKRSVRDGTRSGEGGGSPWQTFAVFVLIVLSFRKRRPPDRDIVYVILLPPRTKPDRKVSVVELIASAGLLISAVVVGLAMANATPDMSLAIAGGFVGLIAVFVAFWVRLHPPSLSGWLTWPVVGLALLVTAALVAKRLVCPDSGDAVSDEDLLYVLAAVGLGSAAVGALASLTRQ